MGSHSRWLSEAPLTCSTCRGTTLLHRRTHQKGNREQSMIESPASKENERVGTNWMLQVQLQPNKHHCKSASDLLLYTQNAPFTAQPYGHRFDPKTPEENRVRMSPKHSGPLASRIWVGHIWVFQLCQASALLACFVNEKASIHSWSRYFLKFPIMVFLDRRKSISGGVPGPQTSSIF